MATLTTDAEKAITFLRFLFGDSPNGYITTSKSKPGETLTETDCEADEVEGAPAQTKKKDGPMISHAYSAPEKLYTEWWRVHSHKYNMYFSTGTTDTREGKRKQTNILDIPALWFDVDLFKYIQVPGKAFLADMKSVDAASVWVESSKDGLQGYYKLDTPFKVDKDPKRYAEHIIPLLCQLAMYYGADMEVCSHSRLMRIPGTFNVKPEYSTYFQVNTHYNKRDGKEPPTYSMKQLKKMFEHVNENTAPKSIVFALLCLFQGSEDWAEGSRHYMMLDLAGTIRKGGINREACKNVFKELANLLSDDQFRDTEVDTTYDEQDLTKLRSLRSNYAALAPDAEAIVDYWVRMKKAYCSKMGIDFKPENYDPIKGSLTDVGDDPFFEKGTFTHLTNAQHTCFSNFVVHIVGKLHKAHTNDVVWLADIVIAGQPVKRVEITPAGHIDPKAFARINHMPTGISVFQPKAWPQYIAWLAEHCPETEIHESTYYGWLDVHKKKPVLLLPDQPSEQYIWTGSGTDTALPNPRLELEEQDIKEYLQTFGEYYSQYHEPHFIWPTLAWFAGCPMSAFFRKRVEGYPVLVVYGLAGSGKSHLFKMLGPHYGCEIGKAYERTTIFAMHSHLTSNNLYPLIIDDFRDNPRPDDGKSKGGQFLGVIRSVWDGLSGSSGRSDRSVCTDQFQAPMCIAGEHPLTEDAAVQRIFSITINHDWLYKIKALEGEDRVAMARRMRWLHSRDHDGWLGTIILQWTINNLDRCKRIMEQCIDKIEAECSTDVTERKRWGFSAILYGLYVLYFIYKEYGLEFPLRKDRFISVIFAADPDARKLTYGSSALHELFRATDSAIIMNTRRNTSLQGSVFVLDLVDREKAYFDINRWRSEIRSYLTSAGSAALMNDIAFRNLLKDCANSGNSPVLGFPTDHPIIQEMCVKIDLARVRSQFGVNTHQWSIIEPKFEEEE